MTPSPKIYYLISFVGRNAKMDGRGLMLSNGFCTRGKGVHGDSWSQEACYLMLYTHLHITFCNECFAMLRIYNLQSSVYCHLKSQRI